MAIALGTATNKTGSWGGSEPFTMTHSHDGDFLIVAVSTGYTPADANPDAVTYNGASMTKVDSHTHSYTHDLSVWVLTTGGSHQGSNTVSITYPGTQTGLNAVCFAQSVSGVDQTTPYGTVGQAAASTVATTCTVDVSSESGGLVIDFVSCKNLNGDSDVGSQGAGQTLILDTQSGATASDVDFGSSYESGAATVTMSWTLSGDDTLFSWKLTAIPLKAAAAAGGHPAMKRWAGVPGMSQTNSIGRGW